MDVFSFLRSGVWVFLVSISHLRLFFVFLSVFAELACCGFSESRTVAKVDMFAGCFGLGFWLLLLSRFPQMRFCGGAKP